MRLINYLLCLKQGAYNPAHETGRELLGFPKPRLYQFNEIEHAKIMLIIYKSFAINVLQIYMIIYL